MSKFKTICVVTGSRAEYGLLSPLLHQLKEDPEFRLQLVVTGMHLSPLYGNTVDQIKKDGFVVDAVVDNELGDDSRAGVVRALARGVMAFAEALPKLAPDLVILLGDRFEILAAAQSAMILGIPVAHLCGGELTEGAFDDVIRHSISKMSALHFVATEPYRQRVIQLGESPDRVFRVGAIGLDGIQRDLMSKDEFQESIRFRLATQNFLITYHPETLDFCSPGQSMAKLLTALDRFPDTACIFTKPNADCGGSLVAAAIDAYVQRHPGRAIAYTSLGKRRYLSAIHHCDLVIGNSSSGLTEVPALHRPTVNIGDRQRGRLKARSVVDCVSDSTSISDAIQRALSESFKACVLDPQSPYTSEGCVPKIMAILRAWQPTIHKQFYDLSFPHL